jgi:hypothetical protein
MTLVRRVLLMAMATVWAVVAAAAETPTPEVDWQDFFSVVTQGTGAQQTVSFTAYVLSLNDKEVTVKGYVSPLRVGAGDMVTIFMLTGTPGSCPFCAGGGVERFVLVEMAAPLKVDLTKEYTLRGRFTVSDTDDSGFYYRIHDAVQL